MPIYTLCIFELNKSLVYVYETFYECVHVPLIWLETATTHSYWEGISDVITHRMYNRENYH